MTDGVTVASDRPTRWEHIRSFSLRDWLELAEASLTLAWAHAALRLKSPARVIAGAAVPRAARTAAVPVARLPRTAWLVGIAGRHIVRVPCLSRAVALARVLARRGAAPDVRIGVRTVGERLEAHAWVVLDGRIINDDESAVNQFVPFEGPLVGLKARRPDFR
jgi:hypothetical protein